MGAWAQETSQPSVGNGSTDNHDYYATCDGSTEAKPNDVASAFTVEAFTLNDATVYNTKAKFTVKE